QHGDRCERGRARSIGASGPPASLAWRRRRTERAVPAVGAGHRRIPRACRDPLVAQFRYLRLRVERGRALVWSIWSSRHFDGGRAWELQIQTTLALNELLVCFRTRNSVQASPEIQRISGSAP